MTLFRKKLVVVNAHQLPSKDDVLATAEFLTWADEVGFPIEHHTLDGLMIRNIEGLTRAKPGSWIIKKADGRFCACKAYMFDEMYEEYTETMAVVVDEIDSQFTGPEDT